MKTKTSFFVLDLSISAISDLRSIVLEIRRCDRDLGEQLRRALSSVALNIAEVAPGKAWEEEAMN